MANKYGKVNLMPKILLLILIILILLVLGAAWFDFLGILDARQTFAPVLKWVGIESSEPVESYADPLLLDKERLEKEQKAVEEQIEQLDARAEKLDQREEELEQRMDELAEREKELEEKEKSFNQRVKIYDNKKANLEQNAAYLNGMPPEKAVEILLGMDDQDMIDVLRTAERVAQEQGTASIVSYWLSLMPAERAATIQRKMAQRPGED